MWGKVLLMLRTIMDQPDRADALNEREGPPAMTHAITIRPTVELAGEAREVVPGRGDVQAAALHRGRHASSMVPVAPDAFASGTGSAYHRAHS